ncbi:hypothetical protein SY83_08985 [Paenibacillus swuensis]|uniref:Uncharacterized protein n=1 Tax=Paenibacillus swuensis TaxID=1178515 RepID=A0A172TH77_9BACL|nr:hypothetical protein [Paenibacillus swuensis]ANE46391.1 hypothetical protein SY83_08985 [Paenibacillus swuensis]
MMKKRKRVNSGAKASKSSSVWKRWVIGGISTMALLVLCGAGYVYYQLQSISAGDILNRNKEAAASGATGNSSGTAVPKPLTGAVHKAGQLTDKPIETQDAMDVASILLKSGLSLKEIMYLQGKATDKLSNAKKLEMREMLLEKLDDNEITALRSVTTKYGKGLVILDPNYPIELVGVYDEKERAKIKADLEKKKPEGGTTAATSITTDKSGADSSKQTEEKDQHNVASSGKPEGSTVQASTKPVKPTAKPSGSGSKTGTTAGKKAADRKYESQLSSLRSSCRSKSSSLIGQIKSEAGGGGLSMKKLQGEYLPKIAAAEGSCDGRFESIMSKANKEYKANGWSTSSMGRWRAEYSEEKSNMQASAAAQLSSLMK